MNFKKNIYKILSLAVIMLFSLNISGDFLFANAANVNSVTSFKNALKNASVDGNTITMNGNVTIEETIILNNLGDVTLDLNGKRVLGDLGVLILKIGNGTNLTIIGKSGSKIKGGDGGYGTGLWGSSEIKYAKKAIIVNGGNCVISGYAEIVGGKGKDGSHYVGDPGESAISVSSGSLTVSGNSKIVGGKGGARDAWYNAGDGKEAITGNVTVIDEATVIGGSGGDDASGSAASGIVGNAIIGGNVTISIGKGITNSVKAVTKTITINQGCEVFGGNNKSSINSLISSGTNSSYKYIRSEEASLTIEEYVEQYVTFGEDFKANIDENNVSVSPNFIIKNDGDRDIKISSVVVYFENSWSILSDLKEAKVNSKVFNFEFDGNSVLYNGEFISGTDLSSSIITSNGGTSEIVYKINIAPQSNSDSQPFNTQIARVQFNFLFVE